MPTIGNRWLFVFLTSQSKQKRILCAEAYYKYISNHFLNRKACQQIEIIRMADRNNWSVYTASSAYGALHYKPEQYHELLIHWFILGHEHDVINCTGRRQHSISTCFYGSLQLITGFLQCFRYLLKLVFVSHFFGVSSFFLFISFKLHDGCYLLLNELVHDGGVWYNSLVVISLPLPP